MESKYALDIWESVVRNASQLWQAWGGPRGSQSQEEYDQKVLVVKGNGGRWALTWGREGGKEAAIKQEQRMSGDIALQDRLS